MRLPSPDRIVAGHDQTGAVVLLRSPAGRGRHSRCQFSLGALVQGRTTLRTDTTQLMALQAENRALSAQVKALHDPASIGRIAHEEYGLIAPGQRSIVVLPGANGSSGGTPDPLADNPIPSSDLLPSDAILGPTMTNGPADHARAELLAPRPQQLGVLALAVLIDARFS